MDDMIDPLERIEELCRERQWSYYQLSKAAKIPYSTLNTMINKQNMPTIPTLFKLCQGFGITVADFFEPGKDRRGLTGDQALCLSLFTSLPQKDRQLALAYMKGLAKSL